MTPERPWPRVASLIGLVWVALIGASIAVSSGLPSNDSSDTKILLWVQQHPGTAKAYGWLFLLIAVVGLFFFGLVRDYLSTFRGAAGPSGVAFGGSVMFLGGFVLEGAPYFAAAEDIHHISTSVVRPSIILADATHLVQDAGLATLSIGFGIAILRGRGLPAWLGWFALAMGVLSAVPIGGIDLIGLFAGPVWSIAASIAMYIRVGWARQPETDRPGPVTRASSSP